MRLPFSSLTPTYTVAFNVSLDLIISPTDTNMVSSAIIGILVGTERYEPVPIEFVFAVNRTEFPITSSLVSDDSLSTGSNKFFPPTLTSTPLCPLIGLTLDGDGVPLPPWIGSKST